MHQTAGDHKIHSFARPRSEVGERSSHPPIESMLAQKRYREIQNSQDMETRDMYEEA